MTRRRGRRRRNQVQGAPESLEQLEAGATIPAKLVEIVWGSSYDSGNQTINAQHRQLFRDINKLLLAALGGRSLQDLIALVDIFLAGVVQYCHGEEATITEAGYPDATAHADLHRTLIDKADELTKRFGAGNVSANDLFEFLARNVVARHILTADGKFFSCVQTKNVGGVVLLVVREDSSGEGLASDGILVHNLLRVSHSFLIVSFR